MLRLLGLWALVWSSVRLRTATGARRQPRAVHLHPPETQAKGEGEIGGPLRGRQQERSRRGRPGSPPRRSDDHSTAKVGRFSGMDGGVCPVGYGALRDRPDRTFTDARFGTLGGECGKASEFGEPLLEPDGKCDVASAAKWRRLEAAGREAQEAEARRGGAAATAGPPSERRST